MKILFLNSSIPNYVVDGLLHGLKSIPGILVVDVPRMDLLYQDALPNALAMAGNRGKTIYKLLTDKNEVIEKRTYWLKEVANYDYVLFTDIVEQCDLFHYLYHKLPKAKRKTLIIIDGYDIPSMFPYVQNDRNLKIRPWVYFYNTDRVLYFKREYENTAQLYNVNQADYPFINKILSWVLKRPSMILPITMSIPEELIEEIPLKDKHNLFVNYNVDPDLKDLFPSCQTVDIGEWKPTFTNQEEYFENIKSSRFGITTKRAGWDCLRHYEYASKGAILCFKNLHLKNNLCAPLGLSDRICISYSDKDDLLSKIKKKSTDELQYLQKSQYEWIYKHTTKQVAELFLNQLLSYSKL